MVSHTKSKLTRRLTRNGFSLIELMIVIGIMGILVQIALPAIHSARESARRMTCQNNLKQIGLSSIMHLDTQKHYPSNGWSWRWCPDPNRGYGKNQPGSWVYNVLSYQEGKNLRALGLGQKRQALSEAILTLFQTSTPGFNCPTRRTSQLLPTPPQLKTSGTKLPIPSAVKSDYAINTGSRGKAFQERPIPQTYIQADDPSFKWYDTSKWNGISFGRSEIKSSQVTDGASKTYLVCEKYIYEGDYLNGESRGDNMSMYSGSDDDSGRCAARVPVPDSDATGQVRLFGSAHPGVWNAVFCDGSVHTLTFEITFKVNAYLSAKADGQNLSENDY